MQRRLADRIQKLCNELVAQRDEKRVQKISGELRSQLRTCVEELPICCVPSVCKQIVARLTPYRC